MPSVWTMNFLRFGFVGAMVVAVTISMLGDRATYNPRTLFRSLRKLRKVNSRV